MTSHRNVNVKSPSLLSLLSRKDSSRHDCDPLNGYVEARDTANVYIIFFQSALNNLENFASEKLYIACLLKDLL